MAIARRVLAVGFGLAMVAAPFLALLYSWTAGLAVMCAGLGATAWLLLDAARTSDLDPSRQRLLLAMTGLNGVLAVVCLIAAIGFWLG